MILENLNGVNVAVFESSSELLDWTENNNAIMVAVNAEKILHAESELRDIINSNLGYIDGAGPMLALKRKGIRNIVKIAGCELWLRIAHRYHNRKSFYLVGASAEIITETILKLRQEFPGINIVGFHDGYLTSESLKQAVIDDVVTLKPDIVFVAMGSPKQEYFMEELQKRHHALYVALGGSFDVYTGKVKRAPRWWIDHNLEFAYRLFKQPKRIRRQIHLLRFAWWILTDKM